MYQKTRTRKKNSENSLKNIFGRIFKTHAQKSEKIRTNPSNFRQSSKLEAELDQLVLCPQFGTWLLSLLPFHRSKRRWLEPCLLVVAATCTWTKGLASTLVLLLTNSFSSHLRKSSHFFDTNSVFPLNTFCAKFDTFSVKFDTFSVRWKLAFDWIGVKEKKEIVVVLVQRPLRRRRRRFQLIAVYGRELYMNIFIHEQIIWVD